MKRLLVTAFAMFVIAAAANAAAATAAVPPTDIATGAAQPSETSARVVGYWNYGSTMPPGIPDSCFFEYGTTVAYGSRADATCSGTSYATLAPLVPGTTYHYRAAGSNTAGTTYGPDKTFTTLGSPPGNSGTPRSPPQAQLKIVRGQSLGSVVRTGLRVHAALTGSCPCKLRAELLVSRATSKRLHLGHKRTIALTERDYPAPQTVNIKLKLKSTVKRRLRRSHSLKVTAKLIVTAGSGQSTASSSLQLER